MNKGVEKSAPFCKGGNYGICGKQEYMANRICKSV